MHTSWLVEIQNVAKILREYVYQQHGFAAEECGAFPVQTAMH
jgi:hypothetical protein